MEKYAHGILEFWNICGDNHFGRFSIRRYYHTFKYSDNCIVPCISRSVQLFRNEISCIIDVRQQYQRYLILNIQNLDIMKYIYFAITREDKKIIAYKYYCLFDLDVGYIKKI